MICRNCGQEWTVGNYCGGCGSRFSIDDESSTQKSNLNKQSESNIQIEELRKQIQLYCNYFMRSFKHPSKIELQGNFEFMHSIISLVIWNILMSSSFIGIIYATTSPYLSFLSLFGRAFLFSLFLTGLVIFSLFLITNFFGPKYSLKSTTNLYGNHLASPLLLAALSQLLILLNSIQVGSLSLSLSLLFAFFILPLYLISFLFLRNSTTIDPLYGLTLYVGTFSVLCAFFSIFFSDSIILNFIIELMSQ